MWFIIIPEFCIWGKVKHYHPMACFYCLGICSYIRSLCVAAVESAGLPKNAIVPPSINQGNQKYWHGPCWVI